MHEPPPFRITVCRFGAWRFACAGLVTISSVVTVGWAMDAAKAHPAWLAICTLVLAIASIRLLLQAWRLAPMSVRWDGQLWHIGPAATMGQVSQAGRLTVALDLGVWMLLRFVTEESRRNAWLPVQRHGHELAWHGLRATVYCARPVSLPIATPF